MGALRSLPSWCWPRPGPSRRNRPSQPPEPGVSASGTGLLRTVTGLEPRDGLVRMRAGELTADLTLAAVAALGLTPGTPVRVQVPPAELTVWER